MDRLVSILSEINEIKQIINQMPEEAVIEKISFQNRLNKILEELEEYVKTYSERLLSQVAKEPDKCKWQFEPEKLDPCGDHLVWMTPNYWITECDNRELTASDQTVTEYWKYCPYCGKEIEVIK